MTGNPVFDRAKFLQRIGGDESLCDEILVVFLEVTPEHLTELEQALDSDDIVTTRRLAHSIKGAASNIDAEGTRRAAQALEMAAASGEKERFRAMFEDIQREFDVLKAVISV